MGKATQYKSQCPGTCLEWGAGTSKRVRDEHLPCFPGALVPAMPQPHTARPPCRMALLVRCEDGKVCENFPQMNHQARKVIWGIRSSVERKTIFFFLFSSLLWGEGGQGRGRLCKQISPDSNESFPTHTASAGTGMAPFRGCDSGAPRELLDARSLSQLVGTRSLALLLLPGFSMSDSAGKDLVRRMSNRAPPGAPWAASGVEFGPSLSRSGGTPSVQDTCFCLEVSPPTHRRQGARGHGVPLLVPW